MVCASEPDIQADVDFLYDQITDTIRRPVVKSVLKRRGHLGIRVLIRVLCAFAAELAVYGADSDYDTDTPRVKALSNDLYDECMAYYRE